MSLKNKVKVMLIAGSLATIVAACESEFNHRFDFANVDTVSQEWILTERAYKELEEAGLPRDVAHRYASRFVEADSAHNYHSPIFNSLLLKMYRSGATPEIADQYDSRFNIYDIISFHENRVGMAPIIINSYHTYLSPSNIKFLYDRGLTPSSIDEMLDGFDNRQEQIRGDYMLLIAVKESGISKEKFNGYSSEFSAGQVIHAIREGVPAEKLNKYNKNFSYDQRWVMLIEGIDPEEATRYLDSGIISTNNILELHKEGIRPQEVNRYFNLNQKYGVNISIEDMLMFHSDGIPYSTVERMARTKSRIIQEQNVLKMLEQ